MIALCSKSKPTKYGEMLVWEQLPDPPYLEECGPHTWLLPPKNLRAYVNGLPVVRGAQVLRQRDLVCVVPEGGKSISYQVVARGATLESGEGRHCSFTGRPIAGPAVRCSFCGSLVAAAVAKEIRSCPACRRPLALDNAPPEMPGEELL